MNNVADKAGAVVKLKKAGVPTIISVLFVLASAPDFWDIFIDRTEEEAEAKAEAASKQVWKAAWEAFEAGGKTELFAQQATLRIQYLEQRLTVSEQNTRNLRDFIMQVLLQERDYRDAPSPPPIKTTKAPTALKPSESPEWDASSECTQEDPQCSTESEVPVQQQLAPMPSLGQMWQEQKEQKKGEFKDKFSVKVH